MGSAAEFKGHLGYADELASTYAWDSTVANARGPAAGDVAIVRDSDWVLGVGRIARIDITTGQSKLRRRCPNPACRSTFIRSRTERTPEFRCGRCGTEFETPGTERIEVTEYAARFDADWWTIDRVVAVKAG